MMQFASSRRQKSGFSLIELVVVLSIIAIISMMLIPTMLDSVAKTQVEAGLKLAEYAQKGVESAWYATDPHVAPANNEAAGLPPGAKISNNYVSSVDVLNGAVNITYGNSAHKAIAGKKLSLRLAYVADFPTAPVDWTCGSKAAAPGKTVAGLDITNIETYLLPFRCKATSGG